MSDVSLLIAELEATEHLLRSIAVENLDYRGILAVERIAHRVCGSLLAGLGPAAVAPPPLPPTFPEAQVPPVEESTDELLVARNVPPEPEPEPVAAVEEAAAEDPFVPAEVPEFDGEIEEIGEAEVTDETPASSSEVLLRWNAEGRPALIEEAEDEDPTLAGGGDEIHEEEPAVLAGDEGEAEPSWVVREEEPAPAYVEEETWENRQPVAPAAAPAADPWAHLVTFQAPEGEEDPFAEPDEGTGETDGEPHDDPWAEQRRMEREVAAPRAAVMEAGRDALDSRVSHDELLPEGDHEPELDELEELELEPEAAVDESGFDDEQQTVIRAAPSEISKSKAPTPVAAPARAAPPKPAPRAGTPIGGTAGLYGSSAAVPTIRDSDDPRPRAAAIQLGAGGGARVLGAEEEDEPIEIGEASDDELPDDDGSGGFSLKVQEYEEVYEEEEEEEEEEAEEEAPLEPDPEPAPAGPSAAQIAQLLAAAQAAAQSGNLQGGADLYSDLIDADPNNVDAHVSRGRLYLDLGDYSRAMSDFMVAEDLAPTDPEPQVAIGDLYFARKDYRKAIDYFDQALQMSPNHAMAFCRRGISHYYRKNYQEAVVDLEKAKKLDPDIANIQTYISMAKKKVTSR